MQIFSNQKIRLVEDELKQLIETKALLTKLYHHHTSQAKPDTPPCSKKTHEQYAGELKTLLWECR